MTLRESTLRRLALGVYAFSLLGLIAGTLLDVSSGTGDPVFSIIVFTFPTVGVIVLSRRPRTTLGWVMLSMGLMFALPLTSYGAYALTVANGSLPGGAVALALGGPSWVPFIGISGYLLLLFPDGHLPSPRWRWFSWMCGVGLVLLSLAIVFTPGTFSDSGFPDVTNPLGVSFLGDWVLILVLFAPLVVVGGAVAVIRRLRRATDPVERQQLRWLAWAAGLIAFLYVLAFIPSIVFGTNGEGDSWDSVLGSIAATSFVLIPITIGIAILRYRLYDIDVVIRKTVVFAVLAAFIAVVYVALVAGDRHLRRYPDRGRRRRGGRGRGGHRCPRLPAGLEMGAPACRPSGVRTAREPLRGARSVRRSARGVLRRRRRARADRARAGRGYRRGSSGCLASGR